MEDFALTEADFQQYYQVNLDHYYQVMVDEGVGFLRYARLFANLPPESRIMKKLAPAASWRWEDEIQSLMLQELSLVNANLYNANRKKGKKAAKPDDQLLPDHVKEAKQEYQEWLKEQKQQTAMTPEEMKEFWGARNPDIKMV